MNSTAARAHLLLTASLLSCLSIWACGFQPFQPEDSFRPQGFGNWYVEDDRPLDCLQRQADYARAFLVDAGVLAQPEADVAWRDVNVWLHASGGRIEGGDGVRPWGLYEPSSRDSGDIEDSRYNTALVHEMLHALDIRRGASPEQTARHEGWDARGWTLLSERFESSVSPELGGPGACW